MSAPAFKLLPPSLELPSRQGMLTQSLDQATRGFEGKEERIGQTAPAEWEPWLRTLFPKHVVHPFGERHHDFWGHIWAIEVDGSPDPFIGIWARGGGKSTSVELAVAALGLRGRRKYCLYVRHTQDRADDSVQNIAALLESRAVETYYPMHADRKVSKFGSSRGWRHNRVWTAGGFTVDAVGLDTAARGVKLEDQRPDLIVFDDIDEKLDTPGATSKKIAVITTSILPAGSSNAAAIGIQNLIIPDGFFSRMTDGRADYLVRRVVSGPHPAVLGLKTKPVVDERNGTQRAVIIAGTATWQGQNLDVCQRQIDDWGLDAFEKEAQHDVFMRPEGLALKYHAHHSETLTDDQCRALVRLGQSFGGIDFGSWRFGFVLRAVDQAGVAHQIGEYFAQKSPQQNHDTHAKAIHAICEHYGCPPRLRVWGDAANPSDITELNRAFARIKSPYRVVAVAQRNKIRLTSIDRINDLLDRNALRYRANVRSAVAAVLATAFSTIEKPVAIGEFLTWQLGMNAITAGTTTQGSRLLWEVKHWSYPIPEDGKAQEQDPNDHTADGADLIASDRYALMSWWRPGKEKEEEEVDAFSPPALAQASADARTLRRRVTRAKTRVRSEFNDDED